MTFSETTHAKPRQCLDCLKEEGQIQGQLSHSDASQYITQHQEQISELKNEQIISEAHDILQPLVEEDWEEEVKQSLPHTEDCENQSKDSSPYGPEDVVKRDDLEEGLDHMQYQTLAQMDYIPALHHMAPVKWVSCVNYVVSGQFLDSEK